MDNIPTTPDGITFIDNPHAPDFFADDAFGFFFNEGVLRITFSASRVNHITSPGPVARVVIGRLLMSEAGAERMALGVLDIIKRRRDAATAPAGNAPAQSGPTIQ